MNLQVKQYGIKIYAFYENYIDYINIFQNINELI